jgi:hypothetical protein
MFTPLDGKACPVCIIDLSLLIQPCVNARSRSADVRPRIARRYTVLSGYFSLPVTCSSSEFAGAARHGTD